MRQNVQLLSRCLDSADIEDPPALSVIVDRGVDSRRHTLGHARAKDSSKSGQLDHFLPIISLVAHNLTPTVANRRPRCRWWQGLVEPLGLLLVASIV